MAMTLRAARINKGLTQVEAAKKLKVSKETIGNWERGKSYPNLKYVKDIEKIYDISYDDLIFLPCNYA